MTGRRSLAEGKLWPQSMGWWWCLIVLGIGGCRGVLAADSAAMEPSGEEGGCTCYRPLSDVISGFLVTLLALAVSLWGSTKYKYDDTADQGLTILLGLFDPLWDLAGIIDNSLRCTLLLWNCHKLEFPDSRMTSPSWLKFLCSSLFPWSKSPVRILVNCDIVVYVSKQSPLLQREWLWRSTSRVFDESEAMVVGENGRRGIRSNFYERKQLSEEGFGWLVWKEVFFKPEEFKCLPKYNELKYLRGNSGFAVIAIAVQAFGYIYAVSFRVAKNLRISPIEVLGFIFNIILLMKALCYSTCNPCHRSLIIYMDEDWEHELDEVNDIDPEKLKLEAPEKVTIVIFFGIFVVLSLLLISFIVKMAKVTNVLVTLPVILFLIVHCLEFLGILFLFMNESPRETAIINFIAVLANVVVYIWAIVGTLLYWKTMHFNVRGGFINLSQIIPFVG